MNRQAIQSPDRLTDSTQADAVLHFIHNTTLSDLPEDCVQHARYLLLDLLGVAAAGSGTHTAQIISNHAVASMAAGKGAPCAPILFDGRIVSPTGAALAGAMMIDSIDAHDGHKLTKGHVGCALLPSVLAALAATGRQTEVDDEAELLTALVIGYEVGVRCGMALHASACDYHTSGAWMAVTVAGVVARIYDLSPDKIWHAMGIGEYHGPRSQMMRVVDHSTMLKDGSGWGAMAGVSAAGLAQSGFTGAPAITVLDEKLTDIWSDLGIRWRTMEQYIKLWPVCRWAQPAMQAVHEILQKTPISPEQIKKIEIKTFREALRLASPHPRSGDEAQYSICWPVAATVHALHEGRPFGVFDVSDKALIRTDIHELSDRITLSEDECFNAAFPAKRQSHVSIHLNSGTCLEATILETKGDPETPLSHEEMIVKFKRLLSESEHHALSDQLLAACLKTGCGDIHPPKLFDVIYGTAPIVS